MGELIGLVAVVMIFGIPMLAIWSGHQQKVMKHRSSLDEGEVRQLVNQVELLQDRVQVLERIVTDQGYSVATQIEALRDTRKVEDRRDARQTEGSE